MLAALILSVPVWQGDVLNFSKHPSQPPSRRPASCESAEMNHQVAPFVKHLGGDLTSWRKSAGNLGH